MFLQLNLKNSLPIRFNQLLCNPMKSTQNNLPKTKLSFFKIEIWCIDQDCIKLLKNLE